MWTAADLRLDGRPVLVKARRYDREPGLFAHRADRHRASQIALLRAQMRFEAMTMNWLRMRGEARTPIVLDLVTDEAPDLRGPHDDGTSGPWTWDDPLVAAEPYLILQPIIGEDLLTYAARVRGGPSWPREALRLGRELAGILQRLHRPLDAQGHYLIYQDLKPGNVIIGDDRKLHLIDFGAITLVAPQAGGGTCSCLTDDGLGILGVPGAILGNPGLGTPGYKPPEMATPEGRRSLDARVDVYGWGATMWALLTGREPPAVPEHGPLDLQALKSCACAPRLLHAVHRACQPQRDERPASMTEVLAMLKEGTAP
ncbi:MAG: hypothetical protein N2688_03185 [Burkholderiaceae bacterium]|nr:hypothetical protein [Burkholderiaceae bacterium]